MGNGWGGISIPQTHRPPRRQRVAVSEHEAAPKVQKSDANRQPKSILSYQHWSYLKSELDRQLHNFATLFIWPHGPPWQIGIQEEEVDDETDPLM